MKSIIVDKRISKDIEHTLSRLGFFVIKAPSHPSLSEAIASHPDTLFFKYENLLFTYADYTERALPQLSDLREYHRDIKFCFVNESPSAIYPKDCGLNALHIGGKIYAKKSSLSNAVINLAESQGIEICDVKQGYAACSVMKLDERTAITSDVGMYKALLAGGIDVLLIKEGGIELPPHRYGFIGGASFIFSGAAYFFGNIERHPDAEKIIKFINKKGLRVISLTNGALADLGGALVFE